MGIRKYKGPVTTVREAADADKIIVVRCLSCGHERQLHAFNVAVLLKDEDVALNEPQPGFHCKKCRRKVEVIVSCPLL